MNCFVYKGRLKADTYLWIPRAGEFEAVPEALMVKLGAIEEVMSLELYPGRRLARTRAEDVMEAFEEHGFYLQLPPRDALSSNALLGYHEAGQKKGAPE
jgi:uncharacterized protein YcgL (UPF0745 family)